MFDSLDLQINIRNSDNNQRLEIQSVLKQIPSGGASTTTWWEFMEHYSSSAERRERAQDRAMTRLSQEQATNGSDGETRKEEAPASPDHRWFDRLDSALSDTPPPNAKWSNTMTPTGQRLMEQYQAVSSVTESQLHLSSLGNTAAAASTTAALVPAFPATPTTPTVPATSSTDTTLTPNGQALQDRASMVTRAQGLIRGLTRTPPTTVPSPDGLMHRMSTFASSTLNASSIPSSLSNVSYQTNNGQTSTMISPPGRTGGGRSLHTYDVPSSLPMALVNPPTPRTPEAIRELFDFSRRMTQPRKQYEDMELSPVKPHFQKNTTTNHHTALRTATNAIASKTRSPYQNIPIRARNQPRHNVSELSASSTLPISSTLPTSSTSSMASSFSLQSLQTTQGKVTTNDSRSAAMDLLSSLRQSLNRNEGQMDFHESPVSMSKTSPLRGFGSRSRDGIAISPLEEVEQHMKQQMNRLLEHGHARSQADQTNRQIMMTIPEVGVASPSSPLSESTPDSVTRSLDTVTKSALDVLSRLRRTNQSLYGSDADTSGAPNSPSFGYLTGLNQATASAAMSSPSFGYLTHQSPALRKQGFPSRITELLSHTSRSMDRSREPPPRAAAQPLEQPRELQQEQEQEQSHHVPQVHISRRGSINITMLPVPTSIDEPKTPGVDTQVVDDVAEPTTPGIVVGEQTNVTSLGMHTVAKLRIRASELASYARADAIINQDASDDEEGED